MMTRTLLSAMATAVVFALTFAATGVTTTASAADPAKDGPLSYKVKDVDGKEVDLAAYKGKVVLIVNTASKCGLTPQYEGLEALYRKYKDKDFVILAFPCNDFGAQEPGSESEIKEFCKNQYSVTFPIFSKVAVKGKTKAPLYQTLTSNKANPKFDGEIKWNFTKFLIGRDGRVVARFEPREEPNDPRFVKSVEDALNVSK